MEVIKYFFEDGNNFTLLIILLIVLGISVGAARG